MKSIKSNSIKSKLELIKSKKKLLVLISFAFLSAILFITVFVIILKTDIGPDKNKAAVLISTAPTAVITGESIVKVGTPMTFTATSTPAENTTISKTLIYVKKFGAINSDLISGSGWNLLTTSTTPNATATWTPKEVGEYYVVVNASNNSNIN